MMSREAVERHSVLFKIARLSRFDTTCTRRLHLSSSLEFLSLSCGSPSRLASSYQVDHSHAEISTPLTKNDMFATHLEVFRALPLLSAWTSLPSPLPLGTYIFVVPFRPRCLDISSHSTYRAEISILTRHPVSSTRSSNPNLDPTPTPHRYGRKQQMVEHYRRERRRGPV